VLYCCYVDYAALRRLVVSRPFKGQMISVQKVPQTCSILVLGVPAAIDNDYISLYFETENYGRGEVIDVKRADDHVVVTFANFEGYFFRFNVLLRLLFCVHICMALLHQHLCICTYSQAVILSIVRWNMITYLSQQQYSHFPNTYFSHLLYAVLQLHVVAGTLSSTVYIGN